MATIDKRLLWIFAGVAFLNFILLNAAIETYESFTHYPLTKSECVALGTEASLQLQGLSWWQILIKQYALVLVLAVAIGWALHGVGFRVL